MVSLPLSIDNVVTHPCVGDAPPGAQIQGSPPLERRR